MINKETILLVDDEPDIIEIIQYNLEKEGYKVITANNGKKAIEIAENKNPDLIILDVMMPEMDGIETCMLLREIPTIQNTLITFLSARGEDYSQIAGFEAGADDYITKPIKPKVLISKIKAILRRKDSNTVSTEKIEHDGIILDKVSYLVTKDNTAFTLPKKEFELLHLLMSNPGNVFTREVIMNEIWGNDVVVGERTIDVHIRKLREKFGDNHIQTIKGVGYKFKTKED
ncbi:MAG: DNA-binding response regulator [Bacteroidetes bacterium]|nr:MAG: DNA-binding response regulator [Bacteroidota bacterium]MBL1143317.1 DNA-binding response regulator [Bacteroidota bacterium]NOG56119.1 response regulator transcription factor [Bacteroidota bacterium]